MIAADRWDSLILYWAGTLWPDVDWRLIKCQIRRESAFNARAVSICGAAGLMQLMPATASSLGVPSDRRFDPEENLRAGIVYLKRQYDRFPEIPDHMERLKFALASYNGGRGYVNRAIALAGKDDAPWQTWESVKGYLGRPDCTVDGKRPDFRQIVAYVESIWGDFMRNLGAAGDGVKIRQQRRKGVTRNHDRQS